jgi:4-diphosphocytidyl-2-C-methyl-D-erythritol kinase
LETTVSWYPSPAKLNLFLHINGRYENGYHQLQSLFQLLDYGDDIGFELNVINTIALHEQIPGVAQSDNLIIKAANILKPFASENAGCTFHINKRLPMGGGIGGGSSNAATVLLVLNKLWHCNLTIDKLADLGLTLGADVPVFVHGNTAFAQGVGEVLLPIKQEAKWFLVATPDVHVSTQAIFTHPELPRNTPVMNFADYSFDDTRNDCETLVSKLHKEVANLLQWLVHYAPSRMTGTGASVFAVFSTKKDAHAALQLLPKKYKGFIAKGVNTSSVYKALQESTL